MPLEPTPDQLGAIEACREAARRYCHGLDRLDGDWMKSAYWPDGTDDHGVFVGNAHEFVDHCMASHARWAFTMHTITNHSVEVDDDGVHARGECYNVTYLQRPDGGGLDVWFGRYLDRYERRGDEWRILQRICVHEGDRREPANEGMQLAADRFRQGGFDRPSVNRPLGP